MKHSVTALVLGTTAAWAQTDWVDVSSHPDPRVHAAAAFDGSRGELVVFGGRDEIWLTDLGDTWVWDGGRWRKVTSPGPAPRYHAAMAYDPVRRETILFGGLGGGSHFADTWRWDGIAWTRLQPVHAPSARHGAAMAFDPVRGRLLLFGGARSFVANAETWEWDGSDWIRLTPASTTPDARAYHGMAFDPAVGSIVMTGGGPFVAANLTWRWNGSDWQVLGPGPGSGSSSLSAVVYDAARGHVVSLGGTLQSDPNRAHEIWEYDALVGAWVLAAAVGERLDSPAAAFDPGARATLVFGVAPVRNGIPTTYAENDLWAWDGVSLGPHYLGGTSITWGSALSFDSGRGRMVAVGGAQRMLTGTAEWIADAWVVVASGPAGPGPRIEHDTAYDAARGETVVFGGNDITRRLVLGDTWTWDGSSWRRRSPAVSPPARRWHSMAYDEGRRVVVLYGGYDASFTALDDTWEWDGVAWRQRRSAHTPGGIDGGTMAYDADRQHCLLFLRATSATGIGTTWAWDGVDWQQIVTTRAPAAASSRLAYDRARRRAVLVRGDRVWEFDGVDWSDRRDVGGMEARSSIAAEYDPSMERVMMLGGRAPTVSHALRGVGATWSYGPDVPARWVPYGAGCQSSIGTPELAPLGGGRPWLGAAFALRLTGLLPAPGSPGSVLIGLSRTTLGGRALPIGLGAAAPGCALWTSQDVAVPVSGSGSAGWSIPIPADPALLGREAYFQGVVVDPAANPLGLALSAAGAAVLGGL